MDARSWEVVFGFIIALTFALTWIFMLRIRARGAQSAASLQAMSGTLSQLSRTTLTAGEGSGSRLSPRRSYLMQLPSAAPLPALERLTCENYATLVRGVAQDIGVLGDAYCAGMNDDAPDPAKLGHVLGRWEDRLAAIADELDGKGCASPAVEGEGDDDAPAVEGEGVEEGETSPEA